MIKHLLKKTIVIKQVKTTFTFLSLLFSSQIALCQNALNFDGIDDVVTTSENIGIIDHAERTVELWIQTTDSGDQSIVGWGVLETAQRFDIRLEDSFLRLELHNGYIRSLNTVLNDGEWHHIAVVVPPTEQITTLDSVLFYVDGLPEPHNGHHRAVQTMDSPITIGANPLIADRFFNGSMDELRIWNVARTEEQIHQYMLGELCDNTGLVVRYGFDEGVANADNTGLIGTNDLITGTDASLENFAQIDTVSNWVEGIEFQGITGTDVQVSCAPFTWIDGITYDTDNNTATFNIVGGATNTCDSLVTLDLTFEDIDPSLTVNDPSISADLIGADYQWLDCNNNFAEIPNESGQTFVASENGSYAVFISYLGCTETSECVDIISTAVNEADQFELTSVYPNPSSGEVNIKLGELKKADISVVDITGKSVFSAKGISTKNYKFNIDAPAGMYLIEVKSDGLYKNYRLIIQK